MAWGAQFALYLAVGVPFAFLPVWLVTRNAPFTVVAAATGMIEFWLFIRVHDVIHYPGGRRMERWRWFRFLDRHHYIHHIDNEANVNFLLPLCDWLFGTLRLELTPAEARRWPAFVSAKELRGPQQRAGAASMNGSRSGGNGPRTIRCESPKSECSSEVNEPANRSGAK